MKEVWKQVVGYEGLYDISNLGRVRRCALVSSNGRLYASKFMKQAIKKGYLTVGLTKDKKQKHPLIHRLVAKAFISNIKKKPQVNHIDGNKFNNKVTNLEWATAKENNLHAIANGLNKVVGSDNPMSKITEKEVLEIRTRIANGELQKDLSKEYGINQQSISNIKQGNTWKHLKIPKGGSMQVETITYSRTANKGDYNSEKLEMTASLESYDNPLQVVDQLKHTVEFKLGLRKDAPKIINQVEVESITETGDIKTTEGKIVEVDETTEVVPEKPAKKAKKKVTKKKVAKKEELPPVIIELSEVKEAFKNLAKLKGLPTAREVLKDFDAVKTDDLKTDQYADALKAVEKCLK